EDLDNPAYQQIKSQLVLLKKDNPDIGFIYLMGFRADESIFFFADSEPPDSPDASSPGDIFVPQGEFPAAKLRQGIELVAGPGADQWGVWVSAFVPVEDAVTGETVTYLGADIDARFWRRQVLLAGMPGFLLMLTLVAILLVWTWLSRRWRQPGLRPPQWVNRLDLAGVLTIGVILSLYIPWRIYLQETKNRWQFFQQVAGSETAQMVWNLKSIRSPGLEGLAAFFYQGKIIHKNDFFHYAQYLLENPLVYFWLWAPAVPAAEADAFAARVRQEEHPDFTIRSGSAEQPHPGRGRDTLYPVLFAEPAHPHQNVIGFDQGSDSVRQAAISTAIHSRLPAATAPVHLLNDPEAALSIVVYHAVFDPEQEELLKGVVAIGLRLSTIQSRNESKRNLLHIDLAMLQEQGPPVLLSDPQQPKHLQPQNRIQRYLFAFGRVFRLDAEPGENFLQSHPLWWHRIVMLVCVTFTGLAGMIVTLISRRRTELEALVNERTLKLAENEYRFRQLLEHSRSLIWDIDEQGCFTFVNEVSETLLGYQADEMIGKMYFHDLYR
ncbi:MAG: PAS domain S-box protein, partial [Oligosphaeraceae bacterium]|nr:PAS domain S-box protein [Oligosphaeraceae bacterium]